MKRLSFIPQLDSFRFLAVLLVMFSHWLPKYEYVAWGSLGVRFFFVLSGYLISSNLLLLKQSIDDKEISRAGALKLFYIRRTLRIFPLYYLVIILLYIFARPVFLGKELWYVSYLSNFLIWKQQDWLEMFSHFWSLAVEEQFYLVWPLLIFLVRWNKLKYLFLLAISFSVIFKAVVFFAHGTYYCSLLPWSNFDAFGIGAVLAYLPYTPEVKKYFDKIPFIGGVLLVVPGVLLQQRGIFFADQFFVSWGSFFIIRKALSGFKGITGKILNSAVLQYLGKISYGLYIFHMFVPWLLRCLKGTETRFPLPIAVLSKISWLNNPLVAQIVQFLLLVGLASLTWYFFEKPFNNLKNRFNGSRQPRLVVN